MPNAETFFKEQTHYILGLIGEPGTGKTRQALTFPACYVICCDPAGIEVLKDPRNSKYASNLIWYEYFAAEAKKEARELFKQTDDPANNTSLYGILAHVKKLAQDGEVKTIVVDGFSYLADLFGLKASLDIAGSSEGDRWAYYRQLKNDLTWFTKANLMTLATRYDLNVIFTAHVQKEAEEQQKKQANREIDIAPRLEGSFRSALAGMPRAMLYLDVRSKVSADGASHTIKYVAYCQRVKVAHMGLIPAKNSYNLPAVLDLTDKSLYDVMESAMSGNGNKQQQQSATK